ncbi:MAG: PDZ domain-containing protein, partial [bacterium]|nr:PDZ domain-containing protein [bacterium]
EAGADIHYRELNGTHGFDFSDTETPLIADYLLKHKRNPTPTGFVWEGAITKFCRYHWFVIDGISDGEREDWHKEYNTTLISDRITIGFTNADYDGAGVKVGFVFEETVAAEIGLESGDVIVAGDGKDIADMDGLNAWKDTLGRGDDIEITARRGDETLKLEGQIPEPEAYEIFVYDKPSALVKASFAVNHIDFESSRLTAFKVLINPDLVDIERNLVIKVDGVTAFDEPVQTDIEYLLRDFLENRDRKEIYVNEIRVEL